MTKQKTCNVRAVVDFIFDEPDVKYRISIVKVGDSLNPGLITSSFPTNSERDFGKCLRKMHSIIEQEITVN